MSATPRSGGRSRRFATEETFLAAYTERRAGRQHDREVLTIDLANEEFGLDIASMREIVRMRTLTEVPRVPSFLRGIITVRGNVVPIVDLRLRMRLPPQEYNKDTRILIVEVEEEPYGLVIDRVLKVVRLFDSQIENAPLPGGLESEFLSGVARPDDGLVVLLNLASVVRFSLERSS